MPEDVNEALTWILTRLTGDLREAKMWPVRLAAVKHQEALSISDSEIAFTDDCEASP